MIEKNIIITQTGFLNIPYAIEKKHYDFPSNSNEQGYHILAKYVKIVDNITFF